MIIGISGKKNAGKDTVADYIVTTLAADKQIQVKNVKFADKLKDMVCLLLNCTIEQLEDREFKESFLGEEWWSYRTSSGALYPYLTYPGDVSQMELIVMTPRLLLQLLGTECGRRIIHPDIWVNSTLAEYQPLYTQYGNVDYYYNLGNCKYECKYKGDYFELTNGDVEKTKSEDELISLNATKVYYEHPNWVISDVRFPNEAKAIKDRNGILIRVNRDITPDKIEVYEQKWKVSNSYKKQDVLLSSKKKLITPPEHLSETALDNYDEFDYTITNNGTIEDLYKKVEKILLSI